MVYHIGVPRSAQSTIDPEFWDRLRETLKSHMKSTGLKQKELAGELGVDPTTLNNFLNRESKALGGLAVALACTVVDVMCNGTKIGRIRRAGRAKLVTGPPEEQLVLEFDKAFELKAKSKHPTIVVRKSATRHNRIRLAITRIG
jgi:transcriptional regulator with XRE-family HTH domain